VRYRELAGEFSKFTFSSFVHRRVGKKLEKGKKVLNLRIEKRKKGKNVWKEAGITGL